MTDPKLEQQARELLAAEWRKSGRTRDADRLISAGYRHWLRDADIDAIRAIVAALQAREFFGSRCVALQEIQSQMRDPERKAVCDILANGKTYVDLSQLQRAVADAERMLWLVVLAAGGSVLVPRSVILAADWSKCELVRQDLLDGIRFTAAPSPEQEKGGPS